MDFEVTIIKTDIFSLSKQELENYMIQLGEKPFRAKQVLDSIKSAKHLSNENVNLPSALWKKVREDFDLGTLELVESVKEKETGTVKYLFLTKDDILIESVSLPGEYGFTLCLSTQAGCAMGCKFCASTKGGLIRNLTVGEMVNQVIYISHIAKEKVTNIVLMGSGEPLSNYKNTVEFLKLAIDPNGPLALSRRHITLSTCGIAPRIKDLADTGLGVNLSISLHEAIDGKRASVMPIATKYPLKELFGAARYYFEITKRKITFEYCLIEGFNDTIEDVRAIRENMNSMSYLLNVIAVNGNENDLSCSDKALKSFCSKLKNANINYTLRRRMGSSINAACGQLRSKYRKG